MTSKWMTLPVWVQIRIPSGDRFDKKIPREKRDGWIKRWVQFLWDPKGMGGVGCETVSIMGKWPKGGKVIFDPRTGEWQVSEENVDGLRMYCTRNQLDIFKRQEGNSLW